MKRFHCLYNTLRVTETGHSRVNVKIKRNNEWWIINFNVISKKTNQTSVSNADKEIQTLGSTENAGNSVNFVSGIIRLPSGWDFSVWIGDRW